MKKVFALALILGTVGSVSAQKTVLDQMKKLAGKTDKIEEARSLIQQAVENPETQNDVLTYYTAGKIEWDAYDKQTMLLAVNPNDQNANPEAMGTELLNGYKWFIKALPLDSLPNAKGEVKPKYSKDIAKRVAAMNEDFFRTGANMFNAKKFYPEAYEAFMIYGDLPKLAFLGKMAPATPDSVRSVAYYNAGLSAWSGNKVREAALAFKKANQAGYAEPESYIYEIACWQNLSQQDSTLIDEAKKNIMEAAQAGYAKFGVAQPLFINNMVNSMITDGKMDEALALNNRLISENPDNAGLYGLRGFIYDRMDNNDASVADYRKAASLPGVDFETLKNASKKVFRVGTQLWNEIDQTNAAERNRIKTEYFEQARDIANKAKSMQPDDSDLDYVLENINYALETYF